MTIAVLGAGNGGLAMAAHLSVMGHEVGLYDKFPEVLAGFVENRQIHIEGTLGKKTADLVKVSTDILEVAKGADMIMIVTPAFAHRELAEKLATVLDGDSMVVLHPGRTGGALEFAHTVRSRLSGTCPLIAEAQTLLYACRRTGPATAAIYGIKREVDFAVLPASRTGEVAAKLCRVFPQFKPVSNVFESSLLNIGAIFHPAPTILNAAWIETTKGNFEHYKQGISPSVAEILETIDEERVHVAGALGVPTKTTIKWLEDVYGVKGGDLYSAVQANEVYAGIKAPPSLDTRYISEDVPMSLVPLSELGRLAGVATPAMDAVIVLAGIVHRKDYRREGRTIERMGLSGLSVQQLKEFVS
jgi:opine dehydrogenase